jgi:hypothetical protein
MSHVLSPSELEPVPIRAIIVNVATELATTIAVASVRAALPTARVLVINCDPAVSSMVHFQYLADAWDFDLLDLPLQWHGVILDQLLPALPDDEVFMLLDSDAEIVDPTWASAMVAAVQEPGVYGSGFLQAGGWLEATDVKGVAPCTCWWPTKFFTCCATLRASVVRDALQSGVSFTPRTIHNDVRSSPTLSRLLAMRFDDNDVLRSPEDPPIVVRPIVDRLPARVRNWLTGARLEWLSWARDDYDGHRPNYVYCDTGQQMHAWCTAQGLEFVGGVIPRFDPRGERPATDRPRSVTRPRSHADVLRWWEPGLTSRLLRQGPDGRALEEPTAFLRSSLRDAYEVDWAEFGVPAWSWPVDFGPPLDAR